MADKTKATSFACGKCGHVNGEKWRMDASVPDWYRSGAPFWIVSAVESPYGTEISS